MSELAAAVSDEKVFPAKLSITKITMIYIFESIIVAPLS